MQRYMTRRSRYLRNISKNRRNNHLKQLNSSHQNIKKKYEYPNHYFDENKDNLNTDNNDNNDDNDDAVSKNGSDSGYMSDSDGINELNNRNLYDIIYMNEIYQNYNILNYIKYFNIFQNQSKKISLFHSFLLFFIIIIYGSLFFPLFIIIFLSFILSNLQKLFDKRYWLYGNINIYIIQPKLYKLLKKEKKNENVVIYDINDDIIMNNNNHIDSSDSSDILSDSNEIFKKNIFNDHIHFYYIDIDITEYKIINHEFAKYRIETTITYKKKKNHKSYLKKFSIYKRYSEIRDFRAYLENQLIKEYKKNEEEKKEISYNLLLNDIKKKYNEEKKLSTFLSSSYYLIKEYQNKKIQKDKEINNNDINNNNNNILKQFPDYMLLPDIPRRTIRRNLDHDYLIQRMKGIIPFLRHLSKYKELSKREDVLDFLGFKDRSIKNLFSIDKNNKIKNNNKKINNEKKLYYPNDLGNLNEKLFNILYENYQFADYNISKTKDFFEDAYNTHDFKVRGLNYLNDHIKIYPGSALFKSIKSDLFLIDENDCLGEGKNLRHDHIATKGKCKQRVLELLSLKNTSFLIILNFQIPGTPSLSIVSYFISSTFDPNDPPSLNEFIINIKDHLINILGNQVNFLNYNYNDDKEINNKNNNKKKKSKKKNNNSKDKDKELNKFYNLLEAFVSIPHFNSYSIKNNNNNNNIDNNIESENKNNEINYQNIRKDIENINYKNNNNNNELEFGYITDEDNDIDHIKRNRNLSLDEKKDEIEKIKINKSIEFLEEHKYFINKGEYPLHDFRNKRLKLIPKVVDGPWVVKAAVGGKPALLGQKVTTRYFRGDRYFEIDVDVGSSIIASEIVSLTRSKAKYIDVNIAILPQGENKLELPEKLIGVMKIKKMNVEDAETILIDQKNINNEMINNENIKKDNNNNNNNNIN